MLQNINRLASVNPRVGLRYITFFLFFSFLYLCLIAFPGVVSAQVPVQIIDIPDPNLRAAINEALGKAPTDAITRAEMETLVELRAVDRDITNLRGIEFAINLTRLDLWSNNISDISAVANLTNLKTLYLNNNSIRDISAVANLTNLTVLFLRSNSISDISVVANLTNLKTLLLDANSISDISAVANLTNLTRLGLFGNTIRDISPVANLTNLTDLVFADNSISDISAVANLTNLTTLYLQSNTISNIVPLIPLTRLNLLVVSGNPISDSETLARLMAQGTVVYFSGTPAFETPGEKITDGWVWLVAPTLDVRNGVDAARSGRDFLSEASGGNLTETDVAFNGATAGTPVGDRTWTSGRLAPTGTNNLTELVDTYGLGTDIGDHPVAYGVVSIESATSQHAWLYIGALPVKVWLNGTLVHEDTYGEWWSVHNYRTAVPVTLNPGENVLFIAAYRQDPSENWGAFFGFQDGTEYTVEPPAPGAGVDIPDPNLRAAIAQALGKAPTDAITRAEMETLGELRAVDRDITDLRGIEFAINLTRLALSENSISDIFPVANLTNLERLELWSNTISDISALSGLTNLTWLDLTGNNISDISPLSNLTNLTSLHLWNNTISDISAVANLTNLTWLALSENSISDISAVANLTNLTRLALSENSISDIFPVANLTNLERLELWSNTISDISALSGLTNLTWLDLTGNNISDISPLSNLTNLTSLHLWNNTISDIFPVVNLTNLTALNLGGNTISDIFPVVNLTNLRYLSLWSNNISDIFPLISLTNLTLLDITNNNISDIGTLEQIMARGTVVYFRGNPAFETPGPKIEDGWVWLIVPATGVSNGSDAVRSGRDFLLEASGGTVTEADVAFNGASAGTQIGNSVWTPAPLDATDPNNLNTLVQTHNLGTEILYPVAYGVVSIQSGTHQQTRVYIGGGPVKVYLNGALIYRDTGHRDFQSGGIYETALPVTLTPGENVLFVAAYRQDPWTDRWGAFFGFQDGTEYTVEPPGPGNLDVNGDGRVDVLDLVQVALFYGKRGTNLPEDVNADGVINVPDLVAVANGIDAADDLAEAVEQALLHALVEAAALQAIPEAPIAGGRHQHALSLQMTAENVAAALADVRILAGSDARLGKWLPMLEGLLQALTELRTIPEATALLPNYPNPFNPETWIPYHLATDAEVILTIYDVRGEVVRTLTVGHQPAGVYQSKQRAAYWDGKNQSGEPVASGLYFYTLTAGDFAATRKLIIRK